jgi:8-oxo-dGTP pyrophosphatase MutT (NUDIX family)
MRDWMEDNKVTAIVSMHPSDFLMLTASEKMIQTIMKEAHSLKQYNDWADKSLPVWLDLEYEGDKARVVSHEGRHRCAALLTAGEDSIDVAIVMRDTDGRSTRQYSINDIPRYWLPQKSVDTGGKKIVFDTKSLKGVVNGNVQGRYQEKQNPKEYWGRAGAGILYFRQATQQCLLTLRSAEVEQPGTWGLPGGSCSGEAFYRGGKAVDLSDAKLWECAVRETREELGTSAAKYEHLTQVVYRDGSFSYTTFIVGVDEAEAKALADRIVLNWENDQCAWFTFDEMWSMAHSGELHFGVVHVLETLTKGRA